MSSEGQTVEGRPGASKESHVFPQKLKGQAEHLTFLTLLEKLHVGRNLESQLLAKRICGGKVFGWMMFRHQVPSIWSGLFLVNGIAVALTMELSKQYS